MRSHSLTNFQLADWLPAGVALDDAITLLAALAVLTTVLAMWQVLRPSSAFERLSSKSYSARRACASRRLRRVEAVAVGRCRLMREAPVTRLNLLRSRHAADARTCWFRRDPIA